MQLKTGGAVTLLSLRMLKTFIKKQGTDLQCLRNMSQIIGYNPQNITPATIRHLWGYRKYLRGKVTERI
jgi:hypothetical protein